MQRIKVGDKVRIISGDASLYGKEGLVLQVCHKSNKAIVEGINKVKCHIKPTANQEKGAIKDKEAWISLSKIALIVPKATRGISKVSYVIDKKTKKKIRVAKKTGTEIVMSTKK